MFSSEPGRHPGRHCWLVRQNVDGLFTATRELVARFLDSRVITNLQARVIEALRGGS